MLRAWFIFIIVIGFAGSLVSRLGSGSPQGMNAASSQWVSASASRSYGRDGESSHGSSSSGSVSQDGSVELERSSDGHFYADVKINGSTVHMLVDTGASSIALSREDASTAGIATSIGMNDVVGEGADGAVHGEWVELDKVELGPLNASGLHAVVLSNGGQSLLGQSFLRKFASVQIEGDRMILR